MVSIFAGCGRCGKLCESARRLKNAIGTKEQFGFELWRRTPRQPHTPLCSRENIDAINRPAQLAAM